MKDISEKNECGQDHPTVRRRTKAVCVAIGLLLLCAAALKLYGLSVPTLPAMASYSTYSVQLAALVWECLLGLWLLSRKGIVFSWFVAACTFLLFAGISARLEWIGEASCGCFGAIKASPWQAFLIDVAALTTLLLCRPSTVCFRTVASQGAFHLGRIAIGTGMSLIVAASAGILLYGSVEGALVNLRSEALTVEPGYVDFGVAQAESNLEASIEVRNWTDAPVRIIGGTSDCSFSVEESLPATVPPHGAISVPLLLKLRQVTPGEFTRDALLWTDFDGQREIRLRVGCRVQ